MEINYIKCSERLPEEFTPKYAKDGHTESKFVLVWDSFYGPSIDRLWNGEWVSDRKSKNSIELAVCHEKTHWAYIPIPEELEKTGFFKEKV